MLSKHALTKGAKKMSNYTIKIMLSILLIVYKLPKDEYDSKLLALIIVILIDTMIV